MSLAGKTCLITGANSGIGKFTAMELAKRKARVIMLCRNLQRAEEAREDIFRQSSNQNVHIMLCDLSSQKQILKAAETFEHTFRSLDILVNNAGIVLDNKREETEDGIEKTFAVNHLAPYSLSLLLLELLRKSNAGRIITVSSEAHRLARFRINDLQLKNHSFNGLNAYAISKLCNIWFTRRLAELTSGSNLMVNCLHPGFVASNFGQASSPVFKTALALSSPFTISSIKGADTPVYLATSPEVHNISGQYFKSRKVKKPSQAALNDEYARALWEQSAALTKLDLHKVSLC
jgi:NAD(P)-dependent dehydrogenase (short-subunit alcohol dehydrogenase family)